VPPNQIQLSATSRLFSSAIFREIATKGKSAAFARLFNKAGLEHICDPLDTVGSGLDKAFSILNREGLRDEYVYRSAVTHKILMGKHSLKTACMLTEFRAGTCKADVVILNGSATVYEIKSERDSLYRLENQVNAYLKVFANVNVITSDSHADSVMSNTPKEVGVLCLTKRRQIKTLRDGKDQSHNTCQKTILQSIRRDEAFDMLDILGIERPDLPNTLQFEAIKSIFVRQDPQAIHSAMVTTLKKTRDLAPLQMFVERLPQSLHAMALATKLKQSEYERLITAMSTPLRDTDSWT
jgi:hypothetical protein